MSLGFVCGITLVLLTISLAVGCDTGWFGQNCNFRCRCFVDKYCSLENQCFSGGHRSCQYGWFGPSCQYVDMAQSDTVVDKRKLHILTDNDETTCLNKATTTVIVSWTQPFLFTWMRVHFSQPSSVDSLALTFKKDNSLEMFCNQSKMSVVSETAADIYCSLATAVDQMILTGSVVGSLCSIHISGGRNVALRKQTSQSSTFSFDWSYLAVDGLTNTNIERGDCTHTALGDKTPTWNIIFAPPVIVTKYVIYNRDKLQERLKGFILTSYGSHGEAVFTYQDNSSSGLLVYTIVPESQFSVSSVSIEATNIDWDYMNKFLTLCEFEVYGDSDCKPGWFGFDCSHKCRCPACLVSTGGCPIETCDNKMYGPNCKKKCPKLCRTDPQGGPICHHTNATCIHGCHDGFKGPQCTELCGYGTYGKDCSGTCSQFCSKGVIGEGICSHIDGTCFHECETGYQGPRCDERCPDGTYGRRCSLFCAASCAADNGMEPVCHHIYGTCLQGCLEGYTGLTCSDKCASGTYGQDCSSSCPEACKLNESNVAVCDHTDGKCLLGCEDGYMGTHCDNKCAGGTYGKNCSSSCPETCKQDELNVAVCDNTDGKCLLGCEDGYMGTHCEKSVLHTQCASGTYGKNCSSFCPVTCKKNEQNVSICDHIDGKCLLGCDDGYTGTHCGNPCPSGTYGNNCSSSCPVTCKLSDEMISACSHIDGQCWFGCQDGYTGKFCEN